MKALIFLVDDDEDELLIFREALEQVPGTFNCAYAGSAELAVAMLKNEIPDFIFIDYNLPRINGLEFLSLFKDDAKSAHTQIFIYSTSISEEVKKMAQNLGATGCIKKTNTIHGLADELKTIVNKTSAT